MNASGLRGLIRCLLPRWSAAGELLSTPAIATRTSVMVGVNRLSPLQKRKLMARASRISGTSQFLYLDNWTLISLICLL
jgi:hypothetical protein